MVSDDRQFLNYRRRKAEREGIAIRHLTTAGFIAGLAIMGALTPPAALAALERIRGRIRAGDYQAARQTLEAI